MADEIITAYLRFPPYYGRSAYKHVAEVKQLCGPTCTWNPVQKLWGTKCTEALQDLGCRASGIPWASSTSGRVSF